MLWKKYSDAIKKENKIETLDLQTDFKDILLSRKKKSKLHKN